MACATFSGARIDILVHARFTGVLWMVIGSIVLISWQGSVTATVDWRAATGLILSSGCDSTRLAIFFNAPISGMSFLILLIIRYRFFVGGEL